MLSMPRYVNDGGREGGRERDAEYVEVCILKETDLNPKP